MMRSERPRVREDGIHDEGRYHYVLPPTEELFIGEPQALHGHAYAISGWPNWLIPTYQIKGHRPAVPTLDDER